MAALDVDRIGNRHRLLPSSLADVLSHCGAIRRRRGACLIHLCGRKMRVLSTPRLPLGRHFFVGSIIQLLAMQVLGASRGWSSRDVPPGGLSAGAPSPPPSRLSDGSCLGAPRCPLTPSSGAVRSRRAARGSVALPSPFPDGDASKNPSASSARLDGRRSSGLGTGTAALVLSFPVVRTGNAVSSAMPGGSRFPRGLSPRRVRMPRRGP